MLKAIGYTLYDNIKCQEDYMPFKKYFIEDEVLCKFTSDATTRYAQLFFIIKDNIESIVRKNVPQRQDEYSTSCMSVGISKDKRNIYQITSRYNHTVNACDNTFNSNLDNIITGLTKAFNKDYNFQINMNNQIEFENFYTMNSKYYYYSRELNGVKYGNNVIDGITYDKNQFLIFDNFIIDLKEKTIKTLDDNRDGFIDIFNEKIKKGDRLFFESNILTIGSMSLRFENTKLISIIDRELINIGDDNFLRNEALKILELPNLQKMGNYNFGYNEDLITLELPNLTTMGDDNFLRNESLTIHRFFNLKK